MCAASTGTGNVQILNHKEVLFGPIFVGGLGLQCHTTQSFALEFSPDRERFAVGGGDSLLSLWRLKELICEATVSRFEFPVRAVGFSYDSKYVASGSENVIDVAQVAS